MLPDAHEVSSAMFDNEMRFLFFAFFFFAPPHSPAAGR